MNWPGWPEHGPRRFLNDGGKSIIFCPHATFYKWYILLSLLYFSLIFPSDNLRALTADRLQSISSAAESEFISARYCGVSMKSLSSCFISSSSSLSLSSLPVSSIDQRTPTLSLNVASLFSTTSLYLTTPPRHGSVTASGVVSPNFSANPGRLMIGVHLQKKSVAGTVMVLSLVSVHLTLVLVFKYLNQFPSDPNPPSLEFMKIGPRYSYLCLIPQPPTNPPPPDDEPDTQLTPVRSWSLLQPLSGTCLYVRSLLTSFHSLPLIYTTFISTDRVGSRIHIVTMNKSVNLKSYLTRTPIHPVFSVGIFST
jgi:hypothetical protein